MSEIPKILSDRIQLGSATQQKVLLESAHPALAARHFTVVGRTRARTGYRIDRASPPLSQIAVTLSGTGRYWKGDDWAPLTAGTALLTPPRAAHAYRVGPRGIWNFVWILRVDAKSRAPLCEGDAPRLAAADSSVIQSLFDGLYREMSCPHSGAIAEHWAALLEWELGRIVQPVRARRLDSFWQEIESRMSEELSLDQLALAAGMSVESLRRCCLAETGRSPIAQLTHARMQRAAALLATTDLKLTAVAAEVGYRCSFAFSKAFKRAWNRSPDTYRRELFS